MRESCSDGSGLNLVGARVMGKSSGSVWGKNNPKPLC